MIFESGAGDAGRYYFGKKATSHMTDEAVSSGFFISEHA